MRKRQGSVIIETMIALAVFAVTAAEVSNAFLLGLKARQLGVCNEDRVIMTTTLMNHLKLEGVDERVAQNIAIPLKTASGTEVWHLRVDPNFIKKIDPLKAEICPGNADHEGLYKLAIEVWKDLDEYAMSPASDILSDQFEIFHYFKGNAPTPETQKS